MVGNGRRFIILCTAYQDHGFMIEHFGHLLSIEAVLAKILEIGLLGVTILRAFKKTWTSNVMASHRGILKTKELYNPGACF
jgi:hypothetical protein